MHQSDIYYSSGGIEVDASYSLREGGMYLAGVGADLPLSCNFTIHGGIQKRFQAESDMRYGAGFLIENITTAVGYDIQIRTGQEDIEHIHLISMQFRLKFISA